MLYPLLSDPDIRYCVLLSLDERFDPHLAQAENLSALFVALNDEVFEIRELAICTVGRLSSMNPAYVMPSLRKTLIQVFVLFLDFHYDNNYRYINCCLSSDTHQALFLSPKISGPKYLHDHYFELIKPRNVPHQFGIQTLINNYTHSIQES